MDRRPPLLAIIALAALLTATVLVAVWRPDVRDPQQTGPRSPVAAADRAGGAAGPGVPESPTARALAVLRGWDARRGTAWAEGDVAGLRDLYAPGSRAGAADARLLRSYLRRGLVVEDLGVQVLAARLRSAAPGRITVVVTDRLAGGTAVGAGGRVRLPRDQPTVHTVRLVRARGSWLVSSVR